MNSTDIKLLLRQSEGQFLERKSCYEHGQGKWRLRKAKDVARDIAKTLAAFTNADGGTLLLNVTGQRHEKTERQFYGSINPCFVR